MMITKATKIGFLQANNLYTRFPVDMHDKLLALSKSGQSMQPSNTFQDHNYKLNLCYWEQSQIWNVNWRLNALDHN